MEPFKEAIVALEFRNQPTISWLYRIVRTLLKVVEEARDGTNETEEMCKLMKQQLGIRFKDVLEDKMFIVAALIDPATSHLLDPEESESARNELAKMVRLIFLFLI